MKIAYCRQVPIEMQESPLWLFDDWPENVAAIGNRQYNSHLPYIVKRVIDDWKYAVDDMDTYLDDPEESYFKSVQDVVNSTFPPVDRAAYTDDELSEWVNVLEYLRDCPIDDEDEGYARILTLITGHDWDTCIIRGCCQGDWQVLLYDKTLYGSDWIEQFECEYFNTGEEWIVAEDNSEEPDDVDNMDGYSVYIRGYDSGEELKKVLEVDKVVMYRPKETKRYVYTREEE